MISAWAWASRLIPSPIAPVRTTAVASPLTVGPPAALFLPLGRRSQGPFHEILKAENGRWNPLGALLGLVAALGGGPDSEARIGPSCALRFHIWEGFKPSGG